MTGDEQIHDTEAGRPLPHAGPIATLGYLRRLADQPHGVLDEIRDSYGPIVGLRAGPLRIAIVGDPGAIADLFAEPTDSYRWGLGFHPLKVLVGPGSLILSDGDDHRQRRGAVMPAFARRGLNGWIPMIVERADAAIDDLVASIDRSGPVVDLYPVGRSIVLGISVRAFCGDRLGERADEIGDLFDRPQAYLESSVVAQFPHPFPFGRRHQVREDRRAFDALVDDEIARIRSERAEPDNVLAHMVLAGDLPDDEIRDQATSLIGAGYHTTAASLAWTLVRATMMTGCGTNSGPRPTLSSAPSTTPRSTTPRSTTPRSNRPRSTTPRWPGSPWPGAVFTSRCGCIPPERSVFARPRPTSPSADTGYPADP